MNLTPPPKVREKDILPPQVNLYGDVAAAVEDTRLVLNRQKDIKDRKYYQVLANSWESKLREDLERLKKKKPTLSLRRYWGLRVRGQHTKTTGRKGCTVGVSKKKVKKFVTFLNEDNQYLLNCECSCWLLLSS